MPRIRFTAHIIHAPQASRTGRRRTLRHSTGISRGERAGREMGRPGRPLPPGWWVAGAVPFGLAFWAGVAWIVWRVL